MKKYLKQVLNKKILVLLGGLSIIAFSSCMDDDSIRDFNQLNSSQNSGIFIVNEGNFTYSNASLSFYNPQSGDILNDVFYNTNSLPLGDVAQSICIRDSLAYIVVNNSGKIYIINIKTFEYVAKITGLTSPRYIHFINNAKAYVSDLYAKKITIIDPLSHSIIGAIDLDNHNPDFEQHNSEQILTYNNRAYVACWSYDNKIMVINTDKDAVEDSITVGKQPNSMVLDKNNNLWVLSDGGFSGSSYGQEQASLTQINLSDNSIIKTFVFNDIDASPSHLQINLSKDSLFFIYGSWGSNLPNAGIFAMSINNQELPQTPIIPQKNTLFYSLGFDKAHSEIYISDAKDYSQAGDVFRFTSSGIPLDTFLVGINPTYFGFNNAE